MSVLDYTNPAFAAYAASAAAMILLVILTAWITVFQMMRVKGGFRAPEDLKRTPLNPDPRPDQTAPVEAVERWRRIMANHLENIPLFVGIGLLFVLTDPAPGLAAWMFYGYAASRIAHFLAYASAQVHDIRATFWTIGSLILAAISVMVLAAAL